MYSTNSVPRAIFLNTLTMEHGMYFIYNTSSLPGKYYLFRFYTQSVFISSILIIWSLYFMSLDTIFAATKYEEKSLNINGTKINNSLLIMGEWGCI